MRGLDLLDANLQMRLTILKCSSERLPEKTVLRFRTNSSEGAEECCALTMCIPPSVVECSASEPSSLI